MRKVYGRPVLLIPLGVVLLVVGVVVGLSGIGAYRAGAAVDEARMCATTDSEPCLVPVEVRVTGPVVTRRAAGVQFSVRATAGERLGRVAVDDADSDRLADLGDNSVTAWAVEGESGDPGEVVAFELPDGSVVSTLWIGPRGLGAYLAWGLLAIGIGLALLVSGLRFRRAGTPWLSADETTPPSRAGPAFLILPAGVAVFLVRLGTPGPVVLGVLGVAVLCMVGALVVPALGRGRR